MRKSRKVVLILAVVLCVLALLGVGAYIGALHVLRQQVVATLGEGGEVQDIRAGLGGIEIVGLHIKARKSTRLTWPTEDELRAERIVVVPALSTLLSDTIVIHSITVENAVMPILRNRAGMQILPGLRGSQLSEDDKGRTGSSKEKREHRIRIGNIHFIHSRIDFYDTTVHQKPVPLPIQDIDLDLDNLVLPALDEKAALRLEARVASQGTLSLKGWLVPAGMDSDLTLKLARVPMTIIEPYLFRGTLGQVKGGELALDLRSRINKRQLTAPGKAIITQLELSGLLGMGRTATALLHGKFHQADNQDVDFSFTLNGNLDDNRFSLNDSIYLQAGSALLKVLGIDPLAGSTTSPAKEISSAIRNLFK